MSARKAFEPVPRDAIDGGRAGEKVLDPAEYERLSRFCNQAIELAPDDAGPI